MASSQGNKSSFMTKWWSTLKVRTLSNETPSKHCKAQGDKRLTFSCQYQGCHFFQPSPQSPNSKKKQGIRLEKKHIKFVAHPEEHCKKIYKICTGILSGYFSLIRAASACRLSRWMQDQINKTRTGHPMVADKQSYKEKKIKI